MLAFIQPTNVTWRRDSLKVVVARRAGEAEARKVGKALLVAQSRVVDQTVFARRLCCFVVAAVLGRK